jgi:hypothetical protein
MVGVCGNHSYTEGNPLTTVDEIERLRERLHRIETHLGIVGCSDIDAAGEVEDAIEVGDAVETIPLISDIDPVDQETIEQYVNELLGSKRINFFLIPDYVEKKIYVNIFSFMLRLFRHVFKTSYISIFNHRIKLTMESAMLKTKKNI